MKRADAPQQTMEQYFAKRRRGAVPAKQKPAGVVVAERPEAEPLVAPPVSILQKMWAASGHQARAKAVDDTRERADREADLAPLGADEPVDEMDSEPEDLESSPDSESEEVDATAHGPLATAQDQQVVLQSLATVVSELRDAQVALRTATGLMTELQAERSALCGRLAEATNKLCKLGAPYPRELETAQKALAESIPEVVRKCREQTKVRADCMARAAELKSQRDQLLLASSRVAADLHAQAHPDTVEHNNRGSGVTDDLWQTWGALRAGATPNERCDVAEGAGRGVDLSGMVLDSDAVGLVASSLKSFVSNIVQQIASQKDSGEWVTRHDVAQVLSSPGFPQL